MRPSSRRRVLLGMGLGATSAFPFGKSLASTVSGSGSPTASSGAAGWGLRQQAHSRLGDHPVEFAEGSLRDDGRYGAVGTWQGEAVGSFLVDLADPTVPRLAHFLPGTDGAMSFDVKFDPRDGLYYRTQQPFGGGVDPGVEIVDYGFEGGSPSDPTIVGTLESGRTHNVFPHPAEPLVYGTNWTGDDGTKGVEIWDVADPTAPRKVNEVGAEMALHDMVLDPERAQLHCAYSDGYVLMDATDPRAPTEVGRFDYRGRVSYREAGLGNEAFQHGHYVTFDPRRELAVMGDEVAFDVPGGKHVFDIGWGEGSPENPIPIGFFISPNATLMEPGPDQPEDEVVYDWTGHNFQILPWGERTLVLSGDWHEGVVLYDLTDPTAPTALDRLPTDASPHPDSRFGEPPFAWSARYDTDRGVGIASDVITGFYTFEIRSPDGSTTTSSTSTPSSSETATGPTSTSGQTSTTGQRTGTTRTPGSTTPGSGSPTTSGTGAPGTRTTGSPSSPAGSTDTATTRSPTPRATETPAPGETDAGWLDFLDFDDDGDLDFEDLVTFVEDLLDV